ENIMMAATLADGVTVLHNAAREPEIVNLAEVLKGMGARISGEGTDVITITGVTSLSGTKAAIIPDRIEAGTFMIAAGMTRGEINVQNCNPGHLEALINKLRDTGMKITPIEGGLHVAAATKIHSVDIKTLPHPGFPTDLQAQMMAYLSIGGGLSVISETVFENRFMHVSELARMGADIMIQGGSAVVRGVPALYGAQTMATDLRASASLVLAGLVAEGTTEISRVYHIDRGYEGIEKKFSALGAQIKRMAQ
ncbi:MAG: UDP-N-acetylglucosamine 1-carboxyvinyltransferase, partial [Smithellaceae bacterium]